MSCIRLMKKLTNPDITNLSHDMRMGRSFDRPKCEDFKVNDVRATTDLLYCGYLSKTYSLSVRRDYADSD